MATAVTEKLLRFNTQELASIAWAFAQLHEAPQLIQEVAVISRQRVKDGETFSAQSMSNLLWSLGKVLVKEEIFMEQMAAMAIPQIAEFTPQALANTAWSFTTLSVSSPAVMTATAAAALPKLSGFSFQGLCNLAWSFSTLAADGPLWDALWKRLQDMDLQASELQLNQVTTLAASFSTMSRHPPPLVAAWVEGALEKLQADVDDVGVEMILRSVYVLNSHALLSERILGFARALLQSVAVKKEATESRDHGSLGLGAGNVAGRPFKEQPHVVTESQELCFLWKPKGWSMTVGKDREGAGSVEQGQLLSEWLHDHLGSRCRCTARPAPSPGPRHLWPGGLRQDVPGLLRRQIAVQLATCGETLRVRVRWPCSHGSHGALHHYPSADPSRRWTQAERSCR